MNGYLVFILIVSTHSKPLQAHSRLPENAPTYTLQAREPGTPGRSNSHHSRRDGADGDGGAVLEFVSGLDVGGCGVWICCFWGRVCRVEYSAFYAQGGKDRCELEIEGCALGWLWEV
jgi:hypothetical protein